MRKPVFCKCQYKGTDQLYGYCIADQQFCFHCIDSTNPLLPKSKILSRWPSSVAVQPGLFPTWLETLKTGLLTSQLK